MYLNSSEDEVHSSSEGEKARVHSAYSMYSQKLIVRTYEKMKKSLKSWFRYVSVGKVPASSLIPQNPTKNPWAWWHPPVTLASEWQREELAGQTVQQDL